MSEVITVQDVRKFHFCLDGLAHILQAHGFTLKDFIRDGFPLEKAEKVDDHDVQTVVAYVKNGRK